jgi:hypothetical protein
MLRLRRLARQSAPQFAMVLVAAGTWLAGCGDDAKPTPPRRGTGGSAGAAGSAGTGTGGSAGSAGSATAGTGGTAGTTGGTAGSAGTSTGGSAGSAGTGTAGTSNVGGEGGEAGAATGGSSGTGGTAGTAGTEQGGQGGQGGEDTGVGGEGGASSAMCSTNDLTVTLVSATGTQQHDHLPINGTFRNTLLGMINTGSPLVFTLPQEGNVTLHDHTVTFTAGQLTTLRNGGSVAMITSAIGGSNTNRHTHTYAISCAP